MIACPYCNSKAHSQPVLSWMVAAYVVGKPPPLEPPAAVPDPVADGSVRVDPEMLGPYYEYACERCKLAEIHLERL